MKSPISGLALLAWASASVLGHVAGTPASISTTALGDAVTVTLPSTTLTLHKFTTISWKDEHRKHHTTSTSTRRIKGRNVMAAAMPPPGSLTIPAAVPKATMTSSSGAPQYGDPSICSAAKSSSSSPASTPVVDLTANCTCWKEGHSINEKNCPCATVPTSPPDCDPGANIVPDGCADYYTESHYSCANTTVIPSADAGFLASTASPSTGDRLFVPVCAGRHLDDTGSFYYGCSCSSLLASECPTICQSMQCPDGHAPSCLSGPDVNGANCVCRRLRGCNQARVLPIEVRACGTCSTIGQAAQCDVTNPQRPEGVCVCSA